MVKLCFKFNIKGRTIKNKNDGMTIIIVLYDKSIIFCESLVSQKSQIKAKREVRGIDIIIAANKDDFFAISETTTIINAVNKVLIM